MLTFKQKIIQIILRIFWIVPVNRKRIAFFSYSATKYNCNPRYISEFVHERFGNDIEIVWYYTENETKLRIPDYAKKFKKNSFMYFFSILTAGTVVTNVTFPRVTPFRKNQLLINTWHGTAFKGDNNAFGNNYNLANYMIAENRLTHEVYRKKDSFNYRGKILDIGMPRNDILINQNQEAVRQIRKEIGLTEDQKIVLYAPTFRDTDRNDFLGIDMDLVIQSLSEHFGGNWKLLYRYHPKQLNRINYNTGTDVSDYPEMQELLLISDVLITDYSSCMWDFSMMKRPVFLYAEDIEKYVNNERGDFYFPFRKLPFPIAENNEELSRAVLNFRQTDYDKAVDRYFEDFGRYNTKGNATEKVVRLIEKKGFRI